MKIMHIIDPSTPEDLLATLVLVTQQVSTAEHHVLALGHESVAQAARAAGMDERILRCGRATGMWDPSGWRSVHGYFRALRPSHLHCWGYWGLVAAAIPRRLPAVRLFTAVAMPSLVQQRLLRFALRRGPWFILCSSREIFDQLRRHGLPRDQLAHVPPGIAAPRIAPTAPVPLRTMLELAPDHRPLVFLGGAPHIHNRQDHGLWATAILEQLWPGIRGVLRLGHLQTSASGRQVARLMAFIQDLSQPEMIVMVEPEVSVGTILESAEVLLFTPDQDIDATIMLRAMALGVPVVATAVPSVLEIVGGSAAALVVPVGQPWQIAAAVQALLSNPELARKHRVAGQTLVEEIFMSARLAERLASLYAQTQVSPDAPLAVPA